MSKKRRLEWSFFLNDRSRVTYNELCRRCRHDCKQSFRAVVIERSTGHSLADQLAALNTLGIDYIGLYRYDSLFNNTAYPTLAAAEQDSVAQIWRGG